MEQIIEGRSLYVWHEGDTPLPVLADGSTHYISCAMPIISEGDIAGCVASVCDTPGADRRDMPAAEVETKLILTAAGFLGRQLEN